MKNLFWILVAFVGLSGAVPTTFGAEKPKIEEQVVAPPFLHAAIHSFQWPMDLGMDGAGCWKPANLSSG